MEQLIQNIAKLPGVQTLLKRTPGGLPCVLERAAKEARSHIVHLLHEQTKKDVVFVFATDYEAKKALENYIYPEGVYLPSPAYELRPVEVLSAETQTARVAAIHKLNKQGGVAFLSIDSLLYKMRPPERFTKHYLTLKTGETLEPKILQEKLILAGYEYAKLVENPGLISGRGEIVECFPPGSAYPYRIIFFDDEIESIRQFDPDNQRSFGKDVGVVTFPPAIEFVADEGEVAPLIKYFNEQKKGRIEGLRDSYTYSLQEQRTFANIGAYADLFAEKSDILAYLNDPMIIYNGAAGIESDYDTKFDTRQKLFGEILAEEGAFGAEISAAWPILEWIEGHLQKSVDFSIVQVAKSFSKAPVIDIGTRSTVSFMGNVDLLVQAINDRIAAGFDVFLYAGGRAKSVADALSERGIDAPISSEVTSGVVVVPLGIEEGFEAEEIKAVYFSETDIFGVRHRKGNLRKNTRQIGLLADLKTGDLIVHEIHGKGKFLGLKTMTVGDASGEYMEIAYRDGDKLFIPTAQIGRIDKYVGPDDETARLSKLGGREWESAKQKARASVKQLAEDLVAIYSERSLQEGFAFSPDTVWQAQFEDNFIYEETPGQEESIIQIKRDMESTKIMDRLLLGDVGYGKTEVAMRACFKAVMDSKQVAMLVPTTLLARQHYKTFIERFTGFPVRIEMLSRYTKNPKQVIENLRSGYTDLVIGTHKLLNKNIKFKDLGLLVIDEEQRFGVSHKERIKDMRRNIDVLTLTATPIPRTLEMAMTGVRDMSTIDTPPDIRKEVQAYVTHFNWGMVRDAILKEMNRGGQIYFVCRRIGEMHTLAAGIQAAVPEARVTSAHGRMSEAESESVMNAFLDKDYDVLLCTTIIESGIDIPSVNTIIIYEADKFGLAQLYQLKGRIGRSNVQGYAYFTHLGGDALTETATKRLEAIREFTQFGSGMKIAMRDLEIRGAGNMLGAEQSGHMANVGYSLYVKMVQEEVAKSAGRPMQPEIETSVELNETALIPDEYIADEALKLDMYRKVAAADTAKRARAVREEFIDRFGPLPQAVENLLGAAVIKGYAARAGLQSVVRLGGKVNLKFADNVHVDMRRLQALISISGGPEIRLSTPPFVVYPLKNGKGYTDMLQFLDKLKHCITIINPV